MKRFAFFFAFLFLLSHLAFGQIPKQISYQGVLTETDGSPVSDGNFSMTFSLYTAASGGVAIWQEAELVAVTDGVFNTILGDVTPLNLDFKNPYWLGVKVGAAAELTPRVKLTASAYSLNSQAVGGYEVSPTPSANKLLPLDATGKIPPSALPGRVSMGGTNGTTGVTISGTTNMEITHFLVNQSGAFDVKLDANLAGEINGDGNGRYEFSIRRGAVDGPMVGRGWWRPGTAGGYQSITISLTGVDNGVNGPTTYYLVGRKYDGGAKDISVFIYYLNATWVAE
ncbi:MAG: hypothetical protein H6563_09745 [Lewinellaceae bacterium]|nr:hypothetical protein [Lewinellaceae bacterium]